MSMEFTGVVESTHERDWKNGIKMYHFTLEGSQRVHNCGTTDPGVKVGESIRFSVVGNKVDSNSIERVARGAGVSPANTSAPAPTSTPTVNVTNGRDQYWKEKEARDLARMPVLDRRAARNDAVRLVTVAMQTDLLPFPKSTKPADKWERLLDLINETTTDLLEQEQMNEQD